MFTWNPSQLSGIATHGSVHGPLQVYADAPRTLLDMLDRTCHRHPGKDALVEVGRRMTYAQFREQVGGVARWLQTEGGLEPGQRVGLLMRNTIEFCVAAFAILLAGGLTVSLNTKLKPVEWERLFRHARLSALIADDELCDALAPLLGGIRLVKESELLALASEVAGQPPTPVFPEPDDPAFILYTSGTTGFPKGATLTHRNIITACINYERCYELDSSYSTLIGVPIFHGTGLFGQLLPFVYLGGTTVLLRTFNARGMLELCERERVRHTLCVPTVYSLLIEESARGSFHLCLHKVGSGGASLSPQLYHRIKQWLPGAHVINSYGLTEATSPAVLMPLSRADDKVGSIGIPTPVMWARLVDPVSRQEVRTGSPGELLLKGPLIIPGYWEDPEQTSRSIEDGWLKTGDLVERDAEGFLYLVDRVRDVINCGGEKVYSSEVEQILQSHPAILEAAVVPAPDDKYGEVVKAVVVLKPNCRLTTADTIAWVAAHLAKYKVPRLVSFTEQLPRNAAGKVLKKELHQH